MTYKGFRHDGAESLSISKRVRTLTMKGGEQSMSKLLTGLQLAFYRAFDEEEGQGLTEYALILALIAVVAIVALKFLSSGVNSQLSIVGSSL
jgi:pilus assembly protein Flp/PilA